MIDVEKWYFLECMVDEEERVSFRMSKLVGDVDYSMNEWMTNAKVIFQKLICNSMTRLR